MIVTPEPRTGPSRDVNIQHPEPPTPAGGDSKSHATHQEPGDHISEAIHNNISTYKRDTATPDEWENLKFR